MLTKPSISVNKLAEYIISKGGRQRKLLHDRKYPDEEFNSGMYHGEAADSVINYVVNGCDDPSYITKVIASMKQLTPTKVGTARRINSNIDSLETFLEMLDDIDMQGAQPDIGANKSPPLVFHGVEISVRPEIILRGNGPRDKKYVGALKFHFSKTRPHTEESAGYVSAALQEYSSRYLAQGDEIVNSSYCFVIDVASGKVFPGVKSITKRLTDIEAECQNIAAIWPTI